MGIILFWLISALVPFVFFIVWLLSPLAGYILAGIGLMRAGRIEKVRCAWLSWIPVGRRFITGRTADRIENEKDRKRYYGLVLLILSVSSAAVFVLASYLMFGGFIKMTVRTVNVITDIFNAGGFDYGSLTGFIRPVFQILKQLIFGNLTLEKLYGTVFPNLWLFFPSCLLLLMIHITVRVLIYISYYKMLKKFAPERRKVRFVLGLICHVIFGFVFVLPACLLRSVSEYKRKGKRTQGSIE